MNTFDFVNAINSVAKKNLIKEDPDCERLYEPYVVNKSFSYFADSVMYANAMNINHHLDRKLQNDYLLNSLRPSKRFAKWVKNYEVSDLEAVKSFFKISTPKARDALRILTPDQIRKIKKLQEEGGERND